MAKKKIIDALNKARADELMAILQYMGHHYEAEGLESPAIMDMFKETAIDEMKHAEKLAERILYLGGTPTYQPSPMKRGGDLKKMVRDDLKAENTAIASYKKYIKICANEGDSTSRLMLEEILSEEEEHADNWETILGVKK
jgi:bacterioferritin